MKATIELVPARFPALLAGLTRLAAKHGTEALQRVHQLLEFALGLKAPVHEDPTYRPQTLFLPGIQPKRFHDTRQPPMSQIREVLERAFPTIREEATRLLSMPDLFSSFALQAYDRQKFKMRPKDWQEAFLRGGNNPELRARVRELCPVTTATLESLPLITGDASFSVIQPHTRIPSHYGEISFRLTAHLPLIVPPDCGLEAGGEKHQSKEGEFFVFDDGFYHDAWNNGAVPRVHLLFMLWNPEVTDVEREALDLIRGNFARPRAQRMSERLLHVLLEERIFQRGRAPGSAEEVSWDALKPGLERLREGLNELLQGGMDTQLEFLQLMRDAQLFEQLNWPAPAPPGEAEKLQAEQRFVCRAPGSFVVVEGVNEQGKSMVVVEYREQRLEAGEAWIPFFKFALGGQAFSASSLFAQAPQGEPAAAARQFLQLLVQEGLLERQQS